MQEVLLEGQDGAGASPHSSLTEHQKMGEWRELLDTKDAEIKQLREESDKLRAELDNEKLLNSLLDKTTRKLEEEFEQEGRPVSKKPEGVPDRFQKMLHTQGPMVGRARSASPFSSDMTDREAVQALEKKLADETKTRTTLEQEIRHLQDQLDGAKGISKEGYFSAATAPVSSKPGGEFSLVMAARIQESEENMQASENMHARENMQASENMGVSEPHGGTDMSQQQLWAQIERQSRHILALKEDIKVSFHAVAVPLYAFWDRHAVSFWYYYYYYHDTRCEL